MSGIKRCTSMTFEIVPVEVRGETLPSGDRLIGDGGRRQFGVYVARRVVALVDEGHPERVRAFQFEGHRRLVGTGELSKRTSRFWSSDPQLAEVKMSARRVVGAAGHKLSGDTAGRRAS